MKIKLEGYPPLEVILAHYNAIPILIQALIKTDHATLATWDKAREIKTNLPKITIE